MGEAATRPAVYLDPELHKARRLKGLETSQTFFMTEKNINQRLIDFKKYLYKVLP